MEHHGSSSSGNTSSGDHPGGPSLSSSDPVNPKRSSTTTIAPAATPPHPTLRVEGDAPGSSTSTTTSLYTLLKRNIQPQGRRNFIPFFRHYDLLRLSECSKDLMGYRHYLSGISLSDPLPSRTKAGDDGDVGVMKGIMGLLSAQGRGGGGLDYLVIGESYVLDLCRSSAEGSDNGCCVTKLQFSGGDPWYPDGEDMSRILMDDAVRGIEELCLDHCDYSMRPVFTALSQGACPHLLRLWIQFEDCEADGLAETLRSGHCQNLQELRLDYDYGSDGQTRVVFEALQEGSCPNLTKIDVGQEFIFPDEATALADLLRSHACPQLKALLVRGLWT